MAKAKKLAGTKEQKETSALMRTAREGDLEGLRRLAESGADPRRPEERFSFTPLMAAAGLGRAECVAFLLPLSNPNHVSDLHFTALSDAVQEPENNTGECVRMLMAASLPTPKTPTGKTLLMLAAESGHAEAVADILAHPEHRGDPRDLDNQQHDALAHAAWSGNAECVRLLLPVCDTEARWATPRKANGEPGRRKRRANPLQIAAEQGRAECVKALAAQFDAKERDAKGRTPLILAAMAGSLEAVETLLPLSDPQALDERGDNALMAAVSASRRDASLKHAAVVARLAGLCDANKANEDGQWPLMNAAANGEVECLRALLPFVDAKTPGEPADGRLSGMTALMWAVRTGGPEAVEILAPISDLDHKTITGHRAFDIGFQKRDRNPKNLDALGPWMAEEDVRAVAEAEPKLDQFPRIKARWEALELAAVVANSEPESSSAGMPKRKLPKTI